MQDIIIAGDALDFDTQAPDYPASDGWAMAYRLVPRTSGTPITIACSTAEDGASFAAEVSSSTTATWAAGEYTWFAYVTLSGERHVVDQGTVTIKADPVAASAFDGRTDARKTLDALKSAYQSYATAGQGGVSEYSIGGRTMKFRNAKDFIDQIRYWERVVADEEVAARLAGGLSSGRKVFTRFMT